VDSRYTNDEKEKENDKDNIDNLDETIICSNKEGSIFFKDESFDKLFDKDKKEMWQ